MMINFVTLGWLPFLLESEYGVTRYNPLRVARQYGLDQGMPRAPPQCVGVTDCWDRYMFATNREQVLSIIGSITLPCVGRKGRCAS